MEWRKQFDDLYKEMRPHLPRCKRINKKAFNQAGAMQQQHCFNWLKRMHDGPYSRLRKLVKDVPVDRWHAYKRLKWNDLEEVKLRKRYEEELRSEWIRTMPSLLRRESKESANS